ncbi:hypothetical protein WJX73_000838 [Symbiochloris irregularis]|uniref:Fe2OG dioxygenase domain-containing protein n=1 Tax=Symbiochloris irregularis TaxID=706552 RepID=A0AAW1NL97_9CHLO
MTITQESAQAQRTKAVLYKPIDLSDFERRKDQIATELLTAATSTGFWHIVGHGIPQEDIDAAFALGGSFFDLPASAKQATRFIPRDYVGWRSLSELEAMSGTRNWEWYSVAYDGPKTDPRADSVWPAEKDLPGFKPRSLAFARQCHEVATRMVSALEQALKVEQGYFVKMLDLQQGNNPSILAWNTYPPKPATAIAQGKEFRLHAHADTDFLTLVFQRPGEPGLEVSPGRSTLADERLGKDLTGAWNGVPSDAGNVWYPMDPVENAITINIGDVFMRITDDILKSTYHRVRTPAPNDHEGERRTIAYFAWPNRDAIIQGPQKKYAAISAADLLASEGNAYAARKDDETWKEVAYRAQHENPYHTRKHESVARSPIPAN